VDDAAVVPRLVLGYGVFFFEDQHAQAGVLLACLHRNREPHNAAADYRDVMPWNFLICDL